MAKVGKIKTRRNTRSEITQLISAAQQHFDEGRIEEARRQLRKAVSLQQKTGKETSLLGRALGRLAETYYDDRNHGRMLPLAERALSIFESAGVPPSDELLVLWLYEWTGWMFNLRGRFDEAARLYRKLLILPVRDRERKRQILARVTQVIAYSAQAQKAYKTIYPKLFSELKKDFLGRVVPETKRTKKNYRMHGETIADPYGWLEKLDSAETLAWRELQTLYAQAFFDSIRHPGEISSRLCDLFYVDYAGLPSRIDGRYYYFMRPADALGRKWCTSKQFMMMPKTLLDEESFDETEKLTDVFMSPDAKWLAYGISTAGSEWQTWRIRKTESGVDLKDKVQEMTVAYVVWEDDGSGFYYGRFEKPHKKAQYAQCKRSIYFHKLGTSQKQDVLIYSAPHNEFVQPYRMGKYLFVYQYSGMACTVLYRLASNKRARFKPLAGGFVGSWRSIGIRKGACLFITDWRADRRRIVSVNMKTGRIRQLIAESEDKLLSAIDFGDCWILHYLHDASSRLVRRDRLGNETVLPTPPYSKIDRCHWFDNHTVIYDVESFSQRPSIRLCDIDARKDKLFHQVLPDHPSPEFVTSKRVVKSKDGTRLLVFISHKKGLRVTARTPLWLTGYGGFGVETTPGYGVEPTAWMELGGIYAVAVIRGGAEFGTTWHESVLKEKRPKVFEDFIAVAQWLIEHGYTSAGKLGISGGSNGGLLVAACMLKRPELFGAVVISNAILDMLRNEFLACGINWIPEYGSVEKRSEYNVIRSYSPLQNVRARVYPPTLIQVGATDDLVHPSNSYKFAAALQNAQTKKSNPIFLIAYENSGHGGAARSSWQGTHEVSFLYSMLTKEF